MSTQELPGLPYEPAVTDAQRERDIQARFERNRFQKQGGRAISARNATTHGLFARDIALPSLGEDPGAFDALLAQFTAQINPGNLLERHYTEQVAAASWRLRRLHRWQAQLFEDPTLTEDQRLDKLDRVQRHETALSRQIDRAVKMLVRELPALFEGRTRRAVLSEMETTEAECREAEDLAIEVENAVKERLGGMAAPPDLDLSRLDTAPPERNENEICQNEPSPGDAEQNCQNEPPLNAVTKNCQNENCQNEPQAEDANDPEQDVEAVHPNGRPVYLTERDWATLQYQRANGESRYADQYDAFARRQFLARQETDAKPQ